MHGGQHAHQDQEMTSEPLAEQTELERRRLRAVDQEVQVPVAVWDGRPDAETQITAKYVKQSVSDQQTPWNNCGNKVPIES